MPRQVACLGLQPHKHLGRTIAALEPHLLNLNEMYGCNVCGEGGEYETLTLDCPMFTKGRIVLDKYEVRIATCGSLRLLLFAAAGRGCSSHSRAAGSKLVLGPFLRCGLWRWKRHLVPSES